MSNRVEELRETSSPEEWKYIPTMLNPADIGSRGLAVDKIQDSPCLVGPSILWKQLEQEHAHQQSVDFPLVNQEEDAEIRKEVKVLKTTTVVGTVLGSNRFTKFSSWRRLTTTIAFLTHIAKTFSSCNAPSNSCKGWHLCLKSKSVENTQQSEKLIIREVQKEMHSKELQYLQSKKPLKRDSPLRDIDPFVDQEVSLEWVGISTRVTCHPIRGILL